MLVISSGHPCLTRLARATHTRLQWEGGSVCMCVCCVHVSCVLCVCVVCMCMCMYVLCVRVCVVCMCVYVCVLLYMCMCVVCVCVCVGCMCVHAHTLTLKNLRNLRRTAEVWLDDYTQTFYDANPGTLEVDFGK